MKYDLYAGKGVWLLVPVCLMPPHAAELKFGRLRPICRFDEALIDRDDLSRIGSRIESDLYAEIDQDTALRLVANESLGSESPQV